MEEQCIYVVYKNYRSFDCWGRTEYDARLYKYFSRKEDADECVRLLPHGGKVEKVLVN